MYACATSHMKQFVCHWIYSHNDKNPMHNPPLSSPVFHPLLDVVGVFWFFDAVVHRVMRDGPASPACCRSLFLYKVMKHTALHNIYKCNAYAQTQSKIKIKCEHAAILYLERIYDVYWQEYQAMVMVYIYHTGVEVQCVRYYDMLCAIISCIP